MFFKIIGYLVVGALMVLLGRLLYEKIVYIKKPIKTVYGEITYDNPARIVVYDFSKFEKDGIVGMIYHSDIKRQSMEDEIRMDVLRRMERENPLSLTIIKHMKTKFQCLCAAKYKNCDLFC